MPLGKDVEVFHLLKQSPTRFFALLEPTSPTRWEVRGVVLLRWENSNESTQNPHLPLDGGGRIVRSTRRVWVLPFVLDD
jgi:hypothetical protein